MLYQRKRPAVPSWVWVKTPAVSGLRLALTSRHKARRLANSQGWSRWSQKEMAKVTKDRYKQMMIQWWFNNDSRMNESPSLFCVATWRIQSMDCRMQQNIFFSRKLMDTSSSKGPESWALNLKEQKSVQYSNNIHSNPHPESNGFWLSSYGWNAASSSNASCRLGIPGLFQGYLQKLEPWVV